MEEVKQIEEIQKVIDKEDLHLHMDKNGCIFSSKVKSLFNRRYLSFQIEAGFGRLPRVAIQENPSEILMWVQYLLREEKKSNGKKGK